MKTNSIHAAPRARFWAGPLGFILLAAALAMLPGLRAPAAEAAAPAPGKTRVGVYDSRAVALAYGRSDWHNKKSRQRMEDYKAAKAAGDKAREAELRRDGEGAQDRLHRQVFGDAPIDDILALFKEETAAVQKKAGVERLAAKAPATPGVEVVDVTPALLEVFHPDAKTLKMIEDLKKHPPLSQDKFPIKD